MEAEIEKDECQDEYEDEGDGDNRFRPSFACRFERVPRLQDSICHGEPESRVVALTNHQPQTLVHLPNCLVLGFHGFDSGESTAPVWRSDFLRDRWETESLVRWAGSSSRPDSQPAAAARLGQCAFRLDPLPQLLARIVWSWLESGRRKFSYGWCV